MERLKITIVGIVQGVGFRPFVYNLAVQDHIGGWVLNDGTGVQIEAEGLTEDLRNFLARLKNDMPRQASIISCTVTGVPLKGETAFTIKKSLAAVSRSVLISPDIATCPDCLKEIEGQKDRRNRYAFTNCTNCGPRYSIIQDVPYDRENTTMAAFDMCPECQNEYQDASNRRFHAQPNACPICGPSYQLISSKGAALSGNPLLEARKLVAGGAILAVKGIGGYHLVCNARDNEAVQKLRARKFREDKPFAVMCRDIKTIREECSVSSAEQELLSGTVRPIVLLAKGERYALASSVAPGNPYLGVMMPYAPVHYILLNSGDCWVMTSGNVSDEPICYQDEEAMSRLGEIADYFLLHNRVIHSRIDDSITRVLEGVPYILRRARGYAPAPVPLSQEGPEVLSVGGELKNTFCLTKKNMAFLSPHIGDLENLATLNSYTGMIAHYERLFAITPTVIAYDMHPEYLSTKYAKTLQGDKVAVQHHHAHIAAVLAEHGVNEKVIGVAFDGTGYGTDGNLWGSEFLVVDLGGFTRLGHFRYLKLPGGAKAIEQPWRQALALLYEVYGADFINLNIPFVRLLPKEFPIVLAATEKKLNTPLSSGAGRLFDVAAALLGIRSTIHYEGQAAIELELIAAGEQGYILPYSISQKTPAEIDFRPAFQAMTAALLKNESLAKLAAAFHLTVAAATIEMISAIHKLTGLEKVAFSGGVFQNITLLSAIMKLLPDKFTILLPRSVPANDGGLSLGQAAVARERSK